MEPPHGEERRRKKEREEKKRERGPDLFCAEVTPIDMT
jgi:hypothetical protein